MERTCTSIVKSFTERIANREIIPADQWLTGAQFLSVLLTDENDKLFALQQQIAQIKYEKLREGNNVGQTNIFIETTDIYRKFCEQKAFIKQVDEIIKISKLQARLSNDGLLAQGKI